MVTPTVLLIARDSALIESVNGLVSSCEELRLETFASVEEVFPPLPRPHVVLLLLHLPASETLQDDRVLTLTRLCPTVVLSDVPEDHQGTALLRAGVVDYLGGPFDQAKLASHIKSCVGRSDCATAVDQAGANSSASSSFHVLDAQMMDLMAQVRRVAPQDTTLL